MPLSIELQRFAVSFLQEYKPFANGKECDAGPPAKKKARLCDKISELEWCRGMWMYIKFIPSVSDCLDMASLLEHTSHSDVRVRWFAASALSCHLGMSESDTQAFFSRILTAAELKSVMVM